MESVISERKYGLQSVASFERNANEKGLSPRQEENKNVVTKRDLAQDPQVQEVLKTQQLTVEEQFMIAQSPNFNLLRDMHEQIEGEFFLDRRVSLDNKAREIEEQKKIEA